MPKFTLILNFISLNLNLKLHSYQLLVLIRTEHKLLSHFNLTMCLNKALGTTTIVEIATGGIIIITELTDSEKTLIKDMIAHTEAARAIGAEADMTLDARDSGSADFGTLWDGHIMGT